MTHKSYCNFKSSLFMVYAHVRLGLKKAFVSHDITCLGLYEGRGLLASLISTFSQFTTQTPQQFGAKKWLICFSNNLVMDITSGRVSLRDLQQLAQQIHKSVKCICHYKLLKRCCLLSHLNDKGSNKLIYI